MGGLFLIKDILIIKMSEDTPKIPTVEIPQGPVVKPEPVRPQAPTPEQQSTTEQPEQHSTTEQQSPSGQSTTEQPPSGQRGQSNVVEINNIQGLSLTDRLFQVKGDISVQISTSEINYLSLANKRLIVHMGSITFAFDTPQLDIEQVRSRLSPVFYKLNINNNLLCFNQKRISYYVFRNTENVAIIVFKNGENLRLTVEQSQRDTVFTNFAEHHEMITRTN